MDEQIDKIAEDLLSEWSDNGDTDNAFWQACIEIHELRSEISRLQSELDNRWIPVSERLPEVEQHEAKSVWVWNSKYPSDAPWLVHYSKSGGFDAFEVTHWSEVISPLPPTRKE